MSISQLMIVSYPHVGQVHSLGFVHSKRVRWDHEAEVWDGFTLSVTYVGSLLPLLDATCHRCVCGGVTISSTLPLNHFSLNPTSVVTQLSL